MKFDLHGPIPERELDMVAIGGGFRVHTGPRAAHLTGRAWMALVAHDLTEGWWEELEARPAPGGQLTVDPDDVANRPRLAAALAGRVDLSATCLPMKLLAEALATSRPGVSAPPFAVPTVEEMRWYAFKWVSPREDQGGLLRAIALVASSLARHGGRAKAHRVERDLFRVYGNRAETHRWMSYAVGRTEQNIHREGHGDFDWWEMNARWGDFGSHTAATAPTPIGAMNSLFDDED